MTKIVILDLKLIVPNCIVLYLSAKLTRYTKNIKNITWSTRLMDSKLSQQQLMYCIRIIFIFVLKYSWMNLFLSFCFIWRYSSVFESLIWLCLSFSVLYLESFSWLCFIFIKRYSSILSHFLDFVFNWRYFLEFLSTFFDDFIFVSNFDLVLHFRFHFILKTKTSHQANTIA